MINDNEVDMVRYMHPNRGQHPVYGPATKKFYGMRSGGGKETFLVQRQDIVSAPQFFQIVSPIPTAPPVQIVAPPPPPVMVQAPAPVPQMREVPPPPVMAQQPAPPPRMGLSDLARSAGPTREDVTPGILPSPPEADYTEEEILREYPEGSTINEDGNVEIPQNPNPRLRALENARFDLQLLPGATPGIIKGMADVGLTTVEAILAGGVDRIKAVKGVGPVRAAMIYGYVFQNFGGGA